MLRKQIKNSWMNIPKTHCRWCDIAGCDGIKKMRCTKGMKNRNGFKRIYFHTLEN